MAVYPSQGWSAKLSLRPLEVGLTLARRHLHFLERVSWWEMNRCFTRSGESVVFKLRPDIIVVLPACRLKTSRTDLQWKESCYWTLLAHCNHGDMCSTTFKDAETLSSFSYEAIADLMSRFVMATPEERVMYRLAPCPPRIWNAWVLGMSRRKAAADRNSTA